MKQNECVMFLAGVTAKLKDRRDGTEKREFMILPFLDELPEWTQNERQKIYEKYDGLGYELIDVVYEEIKVAELDLMELYTAAPTTEEYAEHNQ